MPGAELVVVNRKVLYVGSPQSLAADSRTALEEEFDVVYATRSFEALDLGRRAGPFAVVVSDEAVEDMQGGELLSLFRESWPDTARIMVGDDHGVDAVLEAMREHDILRFVPRDGEQLTEAVLDGLDAFHESLCSSLLIEHLRFVREGLLDMNTSLEGLVDRRESRLQEQCEYAVRVNDADSLQAVAEFAARTCARTLGGCGVRVVLGDPESVSAEACVGPPVSSRNHLTALRHGSQDVGEIAIDLDSYGAPRLSALDASFLAGLAAMTSTAADGYIQRFERDEAQHATILALARLAEHRDNETGQHLDRVSRYCRLLAETLREQGHFRDEITDGFIDNLERSAPLHDIGKVGISDSILLKPGKLDPGEWEIMKTHTVIGAETLRPLVEKSSKHSYLRMGLEIAWCHHEKWNGSGYPRGLTGRAIPLAARILALADCYDALTSRRPYKEPWTHAEAMAYIEGEQGQHFDPEVVRAFVLREREFDEVHTSLGDHHETGLLDSQ